MKIYSFSRYEIDPVPCASLDTPLNKARHVYPTFSQVNQQAALDALLRKLASYRKLLSYYFAWRR